MSDWLTIEVTLTGNHAQRLSPAPGRVLLCHAEHTLADLAEAVDTAFARWDLGHLHEFTVGDRRFMPSPEGEEDVEDSEEVTLADLDLDEGSRFGYVFDLGEEWEHRCEVTEVDVEVDEDDAGEDIVAVFGWGTIPDQYGRERSGEDGDDLDPAEAWEVVAGALDLVEAAAPADLAEQARMLREPAGHAALTIVREVAELDPADDDADLWLDAVAGVVAPQQPSGLDDLAEEAWEAIEHADWAGLVIELVRSGPGAAADAPSLVHLIARCPEVEESDLDENDEATLRQGLALVGGLLMALGVLDDDRRLTPLGVWGLPRALRRAWAGGSATRPD